VSQPRATGGCLCGAVRYEVSGELRGILICHCSRCRRTHGNAAAYSACAREHLAITDDEAQLRWHEHEGARRGFCVRCGGRLFWERPERASISIAAGSLDEPTGLRTSAHIHVASAADWEVLEELPEGPD
jgi:hypothetical protein